MGNDRITRRRFLGAVGAAGLSVAAGCRTGARVVPAGAAVPANEASPEPKGPLNLVVIIADTFRADHLGCYGSERVRTPNLDRLASEGVLFENCYADGLPTIPARRVYFTGRSILPESEWRPMDDDAVTIAEVLQKRGYTTGLVVDTYHYFKPKMNFHRGFDSWQWIRGQESDPWRSGPRESVDPRKHMPEHLWNPRYDGNMRQYLLNTAHRNGEEDYFCMRSCRAAAQWIEANRGQRPFFIWIDMFDPHEPWDAPPRFQKMYRKEYPYERYLFGYGARNADIRPEDIPILRDLYAAEVTFSDHAIGWLLDRIRSMGLMENTVIAFSTDHGTHLGEDGCVQKTAGLLNSCVARLPLIVRHPDPHFAGKRVGALMSAVDYMPTFLDLLEIRDYKKNEGVKGESIWPVVTGEKAKIHDHLFTVFNRFGAVHDREWHYFQAIRGKGHGHGPCLHDLARDPKEEVNVLEKRRDVAAAYRKALEDRLGIPMPPV